MRIVCSIFLLCLLCSGSGYAQTVPTNNTSSDEFVKMLPTLAELIDAAMVHSPAVKIAENEILYSQYELKDANRSWLKQIYLQAEGRYGSEYDIATLLDNSVLIAPKEDNDKLRWGAGLNMRVAISEIVDRKRPAQKARLRIEQAGYNKEEAIQEIRRFVIASYHDLLLLQKTMTMERSNMEFATMYLEKAETDFSANKITMDEYTRINKSALDAQISYEAHKTAFTKAFLLFEEFVGIKLIKK